MDADDKGAASGQEGQPVRAKSPLRYPRHAAPRRYCMQYFERLLLRSPTVCSGFDLSRSFIPTADIAATSAIRERISLRTATSDAA